MGEEGQDSSNKRRRGPVRVRRVEVELDIKLILMESLEELKRDNRYIEWKTGEAGPLLELVEECRLALESHGDIERLIAVARKARRARLIHE